MTKFKLGDVVKNFPFRYGSMYTSGNFEVIEQNGRLGILVPYLLQDKELLEFRSIENVKSILNDD